MTDAVVVIWFSERQISPGMQNSVCWVADSWLTLHFVIVVDGRVKGDLPLSLHHVAWLWCPRISWLLPSFPLKCSRIWLFRRRAWALRGALQRWDWTLGDLCLGGHLPGPGEGGEGEGLLLNKVIFHHIYITNILLLPKTFKLWQDGKIRCCKYTCVRHPMRQVLACWHTWIVRLEVYQQARTSDNKFSALLKLRKFPRALECDHFFLKCACKISCGHIGASA